MFNQLKHTLTRIVCDTPNDPLAHHQRVLVVAGVLTLACVFSSSAAEVVSYTPTFAKQKTCTTEVARWNHNKNTLEQLSRDTDKLISILHDNPDAIASTSVSADTLRKLSDTNTRVKDVLAGKTPPVDTANTAPGDLVLTDAATPRIGTRPLVQPNCDTDSPAQVQHRLSDIAFFTNDLKSVVSPVLHNMGVAEQKFFCTQGRTIRAALLDDKNKQLERITSLTHAITAAQNDLAQAKKLDHTRVEETFDEFSLNKEHTDASQSRLAQYTKDAENVKKTLDTLEQTPEINCSSRKTAEDTYNHSVNQRATINTATTKITQLSDTLVKDSAEITTWLNQARVDLEQRQATSDQIKQERELRKQQEIAANRQAVLDASIPELERLIDNNRLPEGVTRQFIRDTVEQKRAYERRLAYEREQARLEQQRQLREQQRERELREGYEEYLRRNGVDPRTGIAQPSTKQQPTQQQSAQEQPAQ